MWRLYDRHWLGCFVVGNSNISASFRSAYDFADLPVFVRSFLNDVQVRFLGHTFVICLFVIVIIGELTSAMLAPVRIPWVANPVIRQSIWLRFSEVFCFSFLAYIISHELSEVNGFSVVILHIFFHYCGYFLVTTSHNFPQSRKRNGFSIDIRSYLRYNVICWL